MQSSLMTWVADALARAAQRITSRSGILAIGASVAALLIALSPLPGHWGIAGLIALALWAAVWPGVADAGQRRPVAAGGQGALLPLWRQMLDAIPAPAMVLDGRQEVLAGNGAARAIFPLDARRHVTLVARSPELGDAVARAFATRVEQRFALRLITPIERHLEGVATPLSPEPSAPEQPALLVTMHDRTEAEQLAQMRADFVANASHELRTPLATLKGFVETLQGAARNDPAARERFLGIMQGEAARMSRLIEDLLSLSRIEMREHVAPTGKVDLRALAEETAGLMSELARQAGITLALDVPEERVLVGGDHDELMQLAQNLVQNAIKYGRRGGSVRVSMRREGSRAVLSVTDDGMGIAPEHLPRLTERFYRVSTRESRERGGTGLGLAIVKHIANRHRGELRIESTVGKGSTFTLLLPTADGGPKLA